MKCKLQRLCNFVKHAVIFLNVIFWKFNVSFLIERLNMFSNLQLPIKKRIWESLFWTIDLKNPHAYLWNFFPVVGNWIFYQTTALHTTGRLLCSPWRNGCPLDLTNLHQHQRRKVKILAPTSSRNPHKRHGLANSVSNFRKQFISSDSFQLYHWYTHRFGLDESCLESIFCEMDQYEFPNNMQFTKHLLKAIAT